LLRKQQKTLGATFLPHPQNTKISITSWLIKRIHISQHSTILWSVMLQATKLNQWHNKICDQKLLQTKSALA